MLTIDAKTIYLDVAKFSIYRPYHGLVNLITRFCMKENLMFCDMKEHQKMKRQGPFCKGISS
uniref:Uncharacterized protein n=1 Tax=Nelumbo nucifera TaxID=4432 RepID=A0A822Z158_NELNU|nr:TPA_asm: hypothetical protein HUJ06_009091 [Nelumbo nucifera]